MSLRWLPNAICVMRVLLVAPLVLALLDERYRTALVLLVIAGGSDALDGFLAKRFDWRTRLGGLLDPAADKLLIGSVFLTLTYLGAIPLLLAAIVIVRDAVIVLGSMAYHVLIERLHGEPALISKANTACQLAFVLLMLTNAAYGWPSHAVLLPLGAAVVFTSITSGLTYVLRWSRRAWLGVHARA
jgi:cardiolipin synthase (CMP-forming)